MSERTPKEWTRGAIRSHVRASNQRLYAMRGELVEKAGTVGANIGPDIERLGDWLASEMEWLQTMDPVPEKMRRTERASFMASYARSVARLVDDLQTAITKTREGQAVDAEGWKPVGVSMLQVLAHGDSVLRMT